MPSDLLGELEDLLSATGPRQAALERVLDSLLAHFGCATGTIHRLDPADGMLHLVAQRGIPEAIMDRVRVIPIGKGMAGLAAERLEPVQVCNLQTDDSGKAKPAAKMTGMEGSIAFPMIAGGKLRGTMGIAKPVAYDFTPEETALMLKAGELAGGRLV